MIYRSFHTFLNFSLVAQSFYQRVVMQSLDLNRISPFALRLGNALRGPDPLLAQGFRMRLPEGQW